MKASEYITHLVNGEVYKLAISDVGKDMSVNSTIAVTDIQLANRDKFVSYLNLANLAVHKRFHLLQKQFELDSPSDGEEYKLPPDFLAPIYAHYGDAEEEEIPIKDTYKKIVDSKDVAVSLLHKEPFKMMVKGTDTKGRNLILLEYAASPAPILKVSSEVGISDVYTDALINYVAYKAHSAISGDMKEENNTYYLRYESACRMVITSGLGGDNEVETNTKLTDNGFV